MKKFLESIVLFFCVFVLCALPIFSLLAALYTLKLLAAEKVFLLTAFFSLSTTILILLATRKRLGALHTSKARKWMENRGHKLWVAYILFILACISIKNEVILDSASLNNIIIIQWMIFTVSVAIFLVYCGSIKQYLEKNAPSENDDIKGLERLKHLQKKESFYARIGDALSPITLLTINLYVLVLTTGTIYFWFGLNVYTQALTVFSFYLSTNSLCMVFQQTSIPAKNDIETMLKENEVSAKERDTELSKAIVEEFFARLKKQAEESSKGGEDDAN